MSSQSSENIDQILDSFDAAWNGTTPPRIEDFVLPADSPGYLAVLVGLIKVDIERRLKRGEQLTLDGYRQRFPSCADVVEGLLDEARAAAERVATPNRETDDPGTLLTIDAQPVKITLSLPLRMVGDYELLERIPGGGMGEVYKARHRHLDKLVALKLLPAASHGSREMIARFQREMKAVGALDHPHVVEAYDAGEESGVIYLAMKLIEGSDLERFVMQRGPLPINEACELVRQAALGLHYLHQRGLVHRDVKPSNLIRTPDGTVKVLDLGLARWCAEVETGHFLTGLGQMMGTPDYLAPEQIENAADADARADLYGLGGTLFYLLIGRAPFGDHKPLFSKLEAHRTKPPPDVRKLRAEVPEELAALVYRLLAKKPQDRFSSAAEVAAALAPFAGSGRFEQLTTVDQKEPLEVAVDRKTSRLRKLKLAIGLGAGNRSCSLTMAIGLTYAFLIGFGICFFFTWVKPFHHIMSLDVVLARKGNGGLPGGLLGRDVFDSSDGDTVTVDARLERPTYAFLISFRPNGKVAVCFPETEDEPPPLTSNPRYPSTVTSDEKQYGLIDGVGLQAFAVVASRKPLPTFKEWWSQCQECPWKRVVTPQGFVYRAHGVVRTLDTVEVLSRERSADNHETIPGEQLVAELATWLLQSPGIDAVYLVGFTVQPKAQP
jgi:serine/threonine protein kinase